MLAAIAALLVCQLTGEAVVRTIGVPFPGPVVGMILLFALMLARAPLPGALGNTADGPRRGAQSRIAQRRRVAAHGRRGAHDLDHAGGDRARLRGARLLRVDDL